AAAQAKGGHLKTPATAAAAWERPQTPEEAAGWPAVGRGRSLRLRRSCASTGYTNRPLWATTKPLSLLFIKLRPNKSGRPGRSSREWTKPLPRQNMSKPWTPPAPTGGSRPT
ncbi:hypothetical protein ETH_00035405, partial [Eimeria tenella]